MKANTMTTNQTAYDLSKLVSEIENSTDNDTIEVPRKLALTMLRKMLLAERLFESAFYEASASYGTNYVEGRAAERNKDKNECKEIVKYLRDKLNTKKGT